MITASQIHWAAGLLEGEGTFCLTTPNVKGNRSSIRIGLSMCDKDVILRIANLFGFGSLCQIKPTEHRGCGSRGQLQHRWECSGANAAGLMMTILPLMGERRSRRIVELLSYWKANRSFRKPARKRKTFALE